MIEPRVEFVFVAAFGAGYAKAACEYSHEALTEHLAEAQLGPIVLEPDLLEMTETVELDLVAEDMIVL